MAGKSGVETRSRADKKPGVLRLPCKHVEATSTVNYDMFDLRLYCPSTWVHTSNLVLLPQLAQLLLQVYFYRGMIPPNEGMHVPDQLLIPRTCRAGLPQVAGPLLQQQYRMITCCSMYINIYIYIYI